MEHDSLNAGSTRHPAGAFDPSLEGGRASGSLTLSEAGVSFESPKGNLSLPATNMVVEIGGASGEVVFFKHADHPQRVIHTQDRSILAHPLLVNRSDLASQAQSERRTKRTLAAIALSIVAVLCGLIILLVASKDRIVASLADAIPIEWEVKFGDQVFQQLISGRREIQDPALQQQLALITAPLLEGIKDAPYTFRFHIIEDPVLNAFAVPGGHVVIHTGLLLAADSHEEVAGVLAHEIAHVTQRHGFRNVIASLGLYQLVQFFIGDASGVISVIAGNSRFLLERKFSRDFEREADSKGWEYLTQAKIRQDGMIDFFRKMEAEEKKVTGGGSSPAMSLISTHPGTEERIATLEGRWREIETRAGFHVFPFDYDDFKRQLRRIVENR